VSEMTKAPLEFAVKRRMQMAPTSWEAECSAHVAWAKMLIEMMHPVVTMEDWSLMDCQEYFVDLEMSLAGVATALEVSAPGQLRDDQVGVYRELELEVGVARGRTSSGPGTWKHITFREVQSHLLTRQESGRD
jgi:hypothetical protein